MAKFKRENKPQNLPKIVNNINQMSDNIFIFQAETSYIKSHVCILLMLELLACKSIISFNLNIVSE